MPGVPEADGSAQRAVAVAADPDWRAGRCTGSGPVCTSRKETWAPSKEATSSRQQALMAARYSSLIAPRLRYGTSRTANSLAAQPAAAPKTRRPLLNRSMLAATRAVCTGCRYGGS